jgi:hypothetical protein
MLDIDITPFTSFIFGRPLGYLFIKSFGIVFSLIFAVYAVVTFKQVQEITHSVLNERNRFIILYSRMQIMVSLILLLYAIFLL